MTRQPEIKMPYRGAGLILMRMDDNGEQRVLLLKGRETCVWSFPKGHPEAEDRALPLRTAIRETHEETGFVIEKDYTIYNTGLRLRRRHYWIGIMKTDGPVVIARNEHSDYGWFSWAEICRLYGNMDVQAWIKKMERGLIYRNAVDKHLTSPRNNVS